VAANAKVVLRRFEWRVAETELMARPPRVFLLERKNPRDRAMRQLRGFWSRCWSLVKTEKQEFEFTDGSHQNEFWRAREEGAFDG